MRPAPAMPGHGCRRRCSTAGVREAILSVALVLFRTVDGDGVTHPQYSGTLRRAHGYGSSSGLLPICVAKCARPTPVWGRLHLGVTAYLFKTIGPNTSCAHSL